MLQMVSSEEMPQERAFLLGCSLQTLGLHTLRLHTLNLALVMHAQAANSFKLRLTRRQDPSPGLSQDSASMTLPERLAISLHLLHPPRSLHQTCLYHLQHML